MVADLARATALSGDLLPLDGVRGIVVKLLDAVEVDSPHGLDGALLQVTATVDIQAKNTS